MRSHSNTVNCEAAFCRGSRGVSGDRAILGPLLQWRKARCLRHRERRRTRHPKVGAAERRVALSVNVLSLRELANEGRSRLTSGALR